MSNPSKYLRPPATGWRAALARFHASEQGDEGVNKILIIALITSGVIQVAISL